MRGAFGLLSMVASVLLAAGCATLPDTDAMLARHQAQEVQFENARGPLSKRQGAAVLAELQRKSGDIDILEKQIALEQAIAGSPLLLGNKVTLLLDGPATYAAMFSAIRAARDHINIETYIIEDDDIGRQFSDVLLEQQARGVQVNMIYDSFGSSNTPKAFFQRLIDGGIAVVEFNPVNPMAARGQWLINNRDHRKLLVVDGKVAFLGGINISSVYSSGSQVGMRRDVPAPAHVQGEGTGPWRDTDLQLEGPVVGELQKLFMDSWQKQHAPDLLPRDYMPALVTTGNDITRVMASSSDDPYSLMYLTLISAIGNAEREIHLTNAYFVPDEQLLRALKDAAGRGVDVRLILPSHSDSALVFHAGRSHYAELLDGGVKLYERNAALLHAKTAVIDGVWSTVGSTNLDWRSFLDNDEVNAVVIGREFGQRMNAVFAADQAASVAIEPEQWARRGLVLRVKEWFARIWARLL